MWLCVLYSLRINQSINIAVFFECTSNYNLKYEKNKRIRKKEINKVFWVKITRVCPFSWCCCCFCVFFIFPFTTTTSWVACGKIRHLVSLWLQRGERREKRYRSRMFEKLKVWRYDATMHGKIIFTICHYRYEVEKWAKRASSTKTKKRLISINDIDKKNWTFQNYWESFQFLYFFWYQVLRPRSQIQRLCVSFLHFLPNKKNENKKPRWT